jgi:hypothetical protein
MQVWYHGKLQGDLHGTLKIVNGIAWFAVIEDDAIFNEFAISLNTRNHEFTGFDNMNSGLDPENYILKELGLKPGEYEKMTFFNRDALRVTWRILEPQNNEELEFLFDLPGFEPL